MIPGQKDRYVTLRGVSYCPKATGNLICGSAIDCAGLSTYIAEGKMYIQKCKGSKGLGDLVMTAKLRNRLYEIDCEAIPAYHRKADIALVAKQPLGIDIWHRRLAHLNQSSIHHLAKYGMVTGLDIQPNEVLGPCNGCAEGKHPQAPFPKDGSRATTPLVRIHMDLQGPLAASLADYHYSLGTVDCYSRNGWKFYLKKKDEAPDNITSFVTEIETQTGWKVKRMRCDGGSEFINQALKDFAKKKGIVIQTSAPYTHTANRHEFDSPKHL
jgi:GAG-pre-integrase domain/Integrase core domain